MVVRNDLERIIKTVRAGAATTLKTAAAEQETIDLHYLFVRDMYLALLHYAETQDDYFAFEDAVIHFNITVNKLYGSLTPILIDAYQVYIGIQEMKREIAAREDDFIMEDFHRENIDFARDKVKEYKIAASAPDEYTRVVNKFRIKIK